MSRRGAAAQFGVGISTIIRWTRRLRESGSVRPSKIGGYKPKAIEASTAHGCCGGSRRGTSPLRGLVAELGERGLKVDYRSVWTFVHAVKLSFEKKPW